MASHEIKCPHCGESFTIDEAGYADIVQQVRGQEFDRELESRLKLAEDDKAKAVELARQKANSELQQAKASKDAEISELKAQLAAFEDRQKLAVSEAVGDVEKERDELRHEVERLKSDAESERELAKANLEAEKAKAAAEKDVRIQQLQSQLDLSLIHI